MTQCKPLELLTGVRELLADREKWIQGTDAQDILKRCIEPWVVDACRFCLRGAALKVGDADSEAIVVLTKELRLYKENTNEVLWLFNDDKERTHAEILEFLDARIKVRTEEQPK